MNNTQTPTNTGRFSIGEVIASVSVVTNYPGKEGTPAYKRGHTYFPPFYSRMIGVVFSELVFTELTVVEHHRVSSDWDTSGKLEHHGYVLNDECGNVWHNQYPKACYSQTSDQANAIFTRQYPVGTDYKAALEDWRKPYEVISVERLLNDLSTSGHGKINPSLDTAVVSAMANTINLFRANEKALVDSLNAKYGNRYAIEDEEFFEGYFVKRVKLKTQKSQVT